MSKQNPMTKYQKARSVLLIGSVILLQALQVAPRAATMTLAPAPYQTVLDDSGKVIAGACVWTYTAGTTTAATTYTDKAGASPNSNPIVTDATGRFVAYLAPGSSYKFVYENVPCSGPPNPVSHGTVLKSVDNIDGVPASAAAVDVTGTAGETISAGNAVYLSDGSGGKNAGQWYKADTTNAYSSTQPETGFALAAIASASTGSIRLVGQITGLSSLTIGADYYLSTSGAITSTAPAVRRWVGRADSTATLIAGTPPLGPATSTITTTGTQTALALPTGQGDAVIFANNASLLTLQGITAGYDGQRLTIFSIGAARVDIPNQNGSASAANRIITGNGTTISLYAGIGRTVLMYDATVARWRGQSREYELPEFDAGNSGAAITLDFTANGRTQKVTRTANCTYTLTAPSSAGSVVLRVVHETGTATAYTVTFSPAVKFAGGSAPSYTNSSAAIDVLTLYWDGTTWYGFASVNFS